MDEAWRKGIVRHADDRQFIFLSFDITGFGASSRVSSDHEMLHFGLKGQGPQKMQMNWTF
jgi:hypothetical protein